MICAITLAFLVATSPPYDPSSVATPRQRYFLLDNSYGVQGVTFNHPVVKRLYVTNFARKIKCGLNMSQPVRQSVR